MISELTHETTIQLSNLLSRRWNERLVYAGVGDLASPIQTTDNYMNPNKRWEVYVPAIHEMEKTSVGYYLYHYDGTFSWIQWCWTQ
jgi:hypothetical protein